MNKKLLFPFLSIFGFDVLEVYNGEEGLKIALEQQPDFILSETGFIPGGIPPVGFQCKRFVDTSIFEKNIVYAGGGNNLRAYTAFSPTVLEQVYPDILKGDFIVS